MGPSYTYPLVYVVSFMILQSLFLSHVQFFLCTPFKTIQPDAIVMPVTSAYQQQKHPTLSLSLFIGAHPEPTTNLLQHWYITTTTTRIPHGKKDEMTRRWFFFFFFFFCAASQTPFFFFRDQTKTNTCSRRNDEKCILHTCLQRCPLLKKPNSLDFSTCTFLFVFLWICYLDPCVWHTCMQHLFNAHTTRGEKGKEEADKSLCITRFVSVMHSQEKKKRRRRGGKKYMDAS